MVGGLGYQLFAGSGFTGNECCCPRFRATSRGSLNISLSELLVSTGCAEKLQLPDTGQLEFFADCYWLLLLFPEFPSVSDQARKAEAEEEEGAGFGGDVDVTGHGTESIDRVEARVAKVQVAGQV